VFYPGNGLDIAVHCTANYFQAGLHIWPRVVKNRPGGRQARRAPQRISGLWPLRSKLGAVEGYYRAFVFARRANDASRSSWRGVFRQGIFAIGN
jgi:hypothetical protein